MGDNKIPIPMWLDHLGHITEEPLIHFLFWVIVFEVLTGIALAIKQKQWTSKIGLFGLLKHVLAFSVALVIFSYADLLNYRTVGDGVVGAFLFNYAGSLLETWERSGIWFPGFLKPYINTLRKEQEKRIEKLTIAKLEIDEEEVHDVHVGEPKRVTKSRKKRRKRK